MSLQISLFKSVLLFMMLALPYGNISKLFGLEDAFIYLLYPLCFVIFVIAILQRQKTEFPADGIIIVIFISLIASVISYFAGYIDTNLIFAEFFKFMLFILLFDLVKSNGSQSVAFILNNYSNVFFWSLILSLIVYAFVRKPEFIFYDGAAYRFGGFHFELFNFCFSAAICTASLIYKNMNKAIVFCILCFFMYVSKSNFSFMYILIYLISFHTNLLNSLFIRRMATFVILIIPILIGMILDQLSFLSVLSIRESTSFDHSGSSVFTRLYPYSLAYTQLISDGIFSFLPGGFGYFESTEFVKDDPMSYSGTGSPKALVNIGVLLFTALIYLLLKKMPKIASQELRLVNFIWFSSISFISFGSGFFNLFAWTILVSLFFWKKNYV